MQKTLIISTLSQNDTQADKAVKILSKSIKDIEVLYTENYKISNCIGCTNCWLKTPGVCSIKDDYEIIFKKFLKADNVILLTEASLGFISYKMKNIVDRLLPLGVPYTKIYNGEMRHISRYKKCWNIGLIYSENGDKSYLNEWMARFTLNFHSKSIGAFSIEESEVLCNELSNIQLLAKA